MTLEELIASNPESKELKRALLLQMRLKGLKHRQIQEILGVPVNVSVYRKRNVYSEK